jgi:TonB family protein
MLKKTISMPPPIARGQPASLQQVTPPILNAELELLNTIIALWRELPDDIFERHFRQRYFGNESITRQQAIDRLVAISANRFHTVQGDTKNRQDSGGSSATLERSVETPKRFLQQVSCIHSKEGIQQVPTNVGVASADIQIQILPSIRVPWRSMLLSLLTHGLILSLLLSIQLPQRKNRMIDFDTETITYYKMSESFPSVAPKQFKELSDGLSEFKPQSANFQTNQEVRIRPMDSSQSEIVIDQPNVPQISALPKLQLPNILLQKSKMDPGREPLVVSAEVLRHLALDVQQPQSLGALPQNSGQTLATRQPALPLPQLAAPAAPASQALSVSQVAGQFARFQQQSAPLPYAAPPVEDSTAGFQIETMPAQGPDLLVFSARPAIPMGEIAVPKASSTGRLTGSSIQTSQPLLPRDVAELSRAEVAIPSISISNPTAPIVGGAGTAVVQAPVPKPPVVPPPLSPNRVSSLLDFLPSRIPSSKPLVASSTEIGSGESPLRDYESKGGPVYTAAINAPNFTSKRGSWIFRFAELWAVEPPSSPDTPAVSLTAPSAIVKVDPKYAPEVVREKLEGVVILFAILRKDGTIDGESVRVIRKLDSRLDLSAREALLNWKFKPSQRNGIAVDIQMEVSIPFYFRKEGL